jgi:ribosomal small subunit protein bTHX
MGKGDSRTKRGKIFKQSNGNCRLKGKKKKNKTDKTTA